MRKTYFPRLAIRAVNFLKNVRDKFLFTYEEFFAISLYLLVWSVVAGAFFGSLIFVALTR